MGAERTGDAWPLPARLKIPANREVAAALASRPLYAHSDLSDPLAEIDKCLAGRGVGTWFPAPREYSYELRHTKEGVVFLIAYGQRGVALRLGREHGVAARQDGAEPEGLFGTHWFVFDGYALAASNRPGHWCECALAHAESINNR